MPLECLSFSATEFYSYFDEQVRKRSIRAERPRSIHTALFPSIVNRQNRKMNPSSSTPAHSSPPSNQVEMLPPPPGPLQISYSTFQTLVKQVSKERFASLGKNLSNISKRDWRNFETLQITQRVEAGQVAVSCTRALTNAVRLVIRNPNKVSRITSFQSF